MKGEALHDRVRAVILEHGRLTSQARILSPQADLYQAGLSSHAAVNLMLALEDAFDIEFPERMLRRKVFESIAAISEAVAELMAERKAEASAG